MRANMLAPESGLELGEPLAEKKGQSVKTSKMKYIPYIHTNLEKLPGTDKMLVGKSLQGNNLPRR